LTDLATWNPGTNDSSLLRGWLTIIPVKKRVKKFLNWINSIESNQFCIYLIMDRDHHSVLFQEE